MARERKRVAHSFSVPVELLEELREVASEARVAGGMSAVVTDAVTSWIVRYRKAPVEWLKARGMAATTEPTEDI